MKYLKIMLATGLHVLPINCTCFLPLWIFILSGLCVILHFSIAHIQWTAVNSVIYVSEFRAEQYKYKEFPKQSSSFINNSDIDYTSC